MQARPGIRFHELKRTLGLPHGALRHHLAILNAQGLVVLERDGRRLRVRAPRDSLPAVLDPEPQSLLELCRRGGLSIQDAAQELGWSRRKAGYWAKALERRGLLRREPRGRERVLRPQGAATGPA